VRRIANWLCAATLLGGLSYVAVRLGFGALGSHLLHALIALIVGMAMFAAGFIGGGDAKFYTAVAAWFPLKAGLMLFVAVSMSGLALLIIWFVWRRLRGQPIRRQGGGLSGLPYGAAIAAGALILAFSGASP
jgi:prepilin peptidase CpaA